MLDAFIELMDGLFWEGYAEQLSKDNPKAFKIELNEFYNNYSY
jgi:hypothetical protein